MNKFLKKSMELALELSVVVIGKEIGMHFLMNNMSQAQFNNVFVCGGLSALVMMFLMDMFKSGKDSKKQ